MVGAMIDRPSGTATFLFTDVEGSTRLWQEDPDAMTAALARHDVMLRAAISEDGGYVFSTAGDAFAAAFGRAGAAVHAAMAAQRALQAERWPGDIALRVRMGIPPTMTRRSTISPAPGCR
jgi:class 3 adenylate cyclase